VDRLHTTLMAESLAHVLSMKRTSARSRSRAGSFLTGRRMAGRNSLRGARGVGIEARSG
jgi:hypothetical protein